MNHPNRKLRILVAPLDWGLGHTTRCIPVISELLNREVEVWLAGNDTQQAILKKEFPQCSFLPLEGYNVRYHHKGKGLAVKMLAQVPCILSRIKQEHSWLQKIVKEYQIDGVISDNRYGLCTDAVPCVFMTHQLQIKTGLSALADNMLQQLNYRFINKYTYCWIPDFPQQPNLAGDLSHPNKMPSIPCFYVGALSRFSAVPTGAEQKGLLFLISGPEPQRSVLEQIVFSQLKQYEAKVTIVRGVPNGGSAPECANARVFNHLPKDALEKELAAASYVICRSGYSSIMDINSIGAKSILIPTPGQTEQEYLGQYLMQEQFAFCCSQDMFDLKKILQQAAEFPYSGGIALQPGLLQNAMDAFLLQCEQNQSK